MGGPDGDGRQALGCGRIRPHPPDPQATPEGFAQAADADVAGAERGERCGRGGVQPQLDVRLVDDCGCGRGLEGTSEPLAARVVQQEAGRVLVVRHDVGGCQSGL
jgi:hypothetical protein